MSENYSNHKLQFQELETAIRVLSENIYDFNFTQSDFEDKKAFSTWKSGITKQLEAIKADLFDLDDIESDNFETLRLSLHQDISNLRHELSIHNN